MKGYEMARNGTKILTNSDFWSKPLCKRSKWSHSGTSVSDSTEATTDKETEMTNAMNAKFNNNVVSLADDHPLKADADRVKAGLAHVFGAISALTKLNVTVGRVSEVLHSLYVDRPEAFTGTEHDGTSLPDMFDQYVTARAAAARKRGGKTAVEGSVPRASLSALFGASTVAVAE